MNRKHRMLVNKTKRIVKRIGSFELEVDQASNLDQLTNDQLIAKLFGKYVKSS